MAVKGLNHTEGHNRFRFENLSERLQNVDVDIVHRAKQSGTLGISNLPETGESGCYFQDELENLKEMYLTSTFKRFFYSIWSLCQSLPELLFNLNKIAELLKNQLIKSSLDDLPAYLQLVSVLARDTQEDFFPYFHPFFNILTNFIQKLASGEEIAGKKTHGPNPEMVGKIFECMSFLIRYQIPTLVKEYDSLRSYYGPLVGSRTDYVREFSSQMFTIFLRKLSVKHFRSHFKHVFRAIAMSCANKHFAQNVNEATATLALEMPITRIETVMEDTDISIRAQDLLEGVSLMLFATTKGIKDSLHSKGAEFMVQPLSLMLPLSVRTADEIISLASKSATSKKKKSTAIHGPLQSISASLLSPSTQSDLTRFTVVDVFSVYCAGRIVADTIGKLFRHCHPKNMTKLWEILLDHLDETKKIFQSYLYLSEPSLELSAAIEISISFTVEIMDFALSHSNHRGISHKIVRASLKERIVQTVYGFLKFFLESEAVCLDLSNHKSAFSLRLASRTRSVCSALWLTFESETTFCDNQIELINIILGNSLTLDSRDKDYICSLISTGAQSVIRELFPKLSRTLIQDHLLKPVFKAIVSLQRLESNEFWLKLFTEVLLFIYDNRESIDSPENQDSLIVSRRKERHMLEDCIVEIKTLLTSCFSVFLDTSDVSLLHKNSVVYACRCLSWALHFHPTIFKDAELSNSIQKLSESLSTLIPSLISQYSGLKSGDVIIAYVLSTFCYCIRFFLSSSDEILKHKGGNFKKSLTADILCDVTNLISSCSSSLLLLWGFQNLLNVAVCPISEILHGDDTQRNYLVSLLPSREQEKLLNSLSYCLLNPSYWIRRTSIQILLYFPPPAVIQNRTTSIQNEHERDMDDEIDTTERIVYDVVKLCYEAISLPACFLNEREYSRRLAQLEVYINSSKLPTEYSRIISSFCLGMFFSKFQPLWNPAVKVLISAVGNDESESVTWPLILHVLNYLGHKDETNTPRLSDVTYSDPISCLETFNSGEVSVPVSFAESSHFVFHVPACPDSATVPPDSRTDIHTAYDTVWNVFQKCPSITLRHSKVVVPMFVNFLKDQYYSKFSDDPELPTIYFSGFFNLPETVKTNLPQKEAPSLPVAVAKKRLILFLKVFAAVISPKQLFHHQALYKFYSTILSKPDTTVAKLALDCLLTYKHEAIVPYQQTLRNLFDDTALRNELLGFDPSLSRSGEGEGKIESDHRATIIPIIIRILYGRFVSKPKGGKSAREQGLARRNAVLSFLSKVPGTELHTFIHLMLRGFVPQDKWMSFIGSEKIDHSNYLSEHWMTLWHSTLLEVIQNHLSVEDYRMIPCDRQIGFLFLLEQEIKILGFNFSDYIPLLSQIVISLMTSSISLQTEEESEIDETFEGDDVVSEHDAEEETSVKEMSSGYRSQVRAMCLKRLSEMVDQYQSAVDFSSLLKEIWFSLGDLLTVLPGTISGSVSGNSRAPALLKLIHSLVDHTTTIDIIASRQDVVKVLIQCVGAHRVAYSSVKLVMSTLTTLLEYKDGYTLLPQSESLIDAFSLRFLGPGSNYLDSEVKLSDLKITPTGSVKEELRLLAAISTNLFTRKDVIIPQKSIGNLSTLLLGMLRTYTTSKKVSIGEDWANNILTIYRSLVGRVTDIRPHVSFISRLFGPASHSRSLFNLSSVRTNLVSVFEEMAKHPSTANLLMPSSLGIKKLAAVDRKSISTRDFSECMPVFQSLSDEANATTDFPFTWDQILGPSHCGTPIEMSLCNVIVYECLRCMYDTEVAVRGSALSALKTLVSMAGKWSGLHPSTSSSCTSHFTLELIKTIVLPGVHLGIKLGLDNVKKGFVQLLNHIIKNLSRYCLPQDQEAFHTDLFFLTNEDPEQDFFESITHIQLHRRSRVLLKLKGLLSTNRNITNRSFLNVLLPLAFYPLLSEEFKKKEHAVLLQESSSLIGMIAFYLKWGQYYALIKQLLKHLRRNKDKEKLFLSTLCSVLESFHFDLTVHTTDNETSKVEEEDGHGDDDDEESDNEQEAKEETELDQSPPPLLISSNEHIIQCVLNTIYPQVKSFLIKHGKDHTGGKTEIVRPLIAVALIKLLKRFEPPLLSKEKRNGLFTNLVLNVVNTLKTKDSAARDMARESLAKMVTSMGLESLGLVLDELSHSLSQGYQRHVRNYTVRSLLTTVLANYSPPIDAESILDVNGVNNIEISEDDVVFPSFDQCIPLIMQFCLDEIEGTTFEDKNVDDAKRTLIREAKGNKANEIFELCGRCLLFRPSNALANPQLSSVHLLITPLLEALRQSQKNDFSTTTSGLMGRTTEGLLRASIGLSKNPSLKGTELFLYLHSTLTPFVATLLKELKSRKETAGNIKIDQSGEDEALSSYIPSYLKEESSDEDEAALYSKKQKTDKSKQTKANVWLPSERKVNTAQREAIERRNEERRELFLVQDGASAPKLTGRNRYKRKLANHEGKNFLEDDPAFTAAVKFCLSLLLSCLKQKRLDESDPIVREMATPFLPLFAQCLRISGNSGIVVLAMRCICGLLSWGLPVEPAFSRSIGKRMLELIYQGGAVLSTDNDLVQTCIKGLYSLFLLYNKSKNQAKDFATFNPLNSSVDEIADTPLPKKSNEKLPLDIDSIRTLLSLLTSSILEVSTSYQNSSFQLIRAIVDSRIVVPEMYDLMKALIEQVVLSHRKGVRDVASTVVVTFLLSYPLGKKRLESHIKQFVANCSYEFEEGRFAALGLILDLCRLLPVPVLDEYALLIYLPMAMQVVNDNSSTCRSRAGDVITMLIRRCSVEMATQCWNYSLQWLGIQNEPGQLETYQGRCVDISQRPLMRTGAQVAGIVVGSRHDIIKRNMVNNILLMMTAVLTQFALVENKIDLEQEQETAVVTENEGDGNVGGLETWALLYHFLTLLERLFEQLPLVVEKSIVMIQKSDNPPRHLFELLEEAMLFPHAWVRSVSCRIIKSYLQRRDPIASNFGSIAHGSSSVSEIEILLTPNALYNLARRLCLMLNYPVILPSLLPSLTSCLVFVIRAMYYHPSLVTKIDQPLEEEVDSEPKSEDENDESSPSVPTELSLVASSNWAMQRLRAIGGDPRGSKRLNVLKIFRELVKVETPKFVGDHLRQFIEVCLRKRRDESIRSDTNELLEVSAQLLQELEACVGAPIFIGAYSEVQSRMDKFKVEKKRREAAEAVYDPRAFALKKVEKSRQKQESKKRKNQKYAVLNGSKRQRSPAILIAEEDSY